MGYRFLDIIARFILKEQELHIGFGEADRVRLLVMSIPAIPLYSRLVIFIQPGFLKVCAVIALMVLYPIVPSWIISNKIEKYISDTKKAKQLRKKIKITTAEYWIISIVFFLVSVLLALLINFGLSTIGL